jgi:hypothetical protein
MNFATARITPEVLKTLYANGFNHNKVVVISEDDDSSQAEEFFIPYRSNTLNSGSHCNISSSNNK